MGIPKQQRVNNEWSRYSERSRNNFVWTHQHFRPLVVLPCSWPSIFVIYPNAHLSCSSQRASVERHPIDMRVSEQVLVVPSASGRRGPESVVGAGRWADTIASECNCANQYRSDVSHDWLIPWRIWEINHLILSSRVLKDKFQGVPPSRQPNAATPELLQGILGYNSSVFDTRSHGN